MIGRVSTAFETYCGRIFNSATYTEYYDGNGHSNLYLDQYPVTSITSINDDTSWLWTSSTLIPSASYRIQDKRMVVYNGNFSNPGIQSVKVVYVAGYTDIPEDLRQSCVEESARKFKHRTDFDETAKTMGDGSATFQELDILPQTKRILNSYRMQAVM